MFTIQAAKEAQFHEVRSFYHKLIDMMEGAEYHPQGEKGLYPTDEYLLSAIRRGTLYLGRLDGEPTAAMVVNSDCNEGYRQVNWRVQAADSEVSVIHILGVLPSHSGKGLAKSLVRHTFALARQKGHKAVRLDVLKGNLPAEKLYTGLGFQYITSVPMFYEDTGWTDFLLYEYPL